MSSGAADDRVYSTNRQERMEEQEEEDRYYFSPHERERSSYSSDEESAGFVTTVAAAVVVVSVSAGRTRLPPGTSISQLFTTHWTQREQSGAFTRIRRYFPSRVAIFFSLYSYAMVLPIGYVVHLCFPPKSVFDLVLYNKNKIKMLNNTRYNENK